MTKRRPNGAREREARRQGFPEYDGLTIDQLYGERKSLGLQLEEMGKTMREMSIRNAHLKFRIRAARDGDSGIGISDHAVIRYLERVKGMDLSAVRDEIRTRIATKNVDGSIRDQIVKDGDVSFAIYDGERISTVWAEPARTGTT